MYEEGLPNIWRNAQIFPPIWGGLSHIDFATAPFWISLYMRKIFFSIYQWRKTARRGNKYDTDITVHVCCLRVPFICFDLTPYSRSFPLPKGVCTLQYRWHVQSSMWVERGIIYCTFPHTGLVMSYRTSLRFCIDHADVMRWRSYICNVYWASTVNVDLTSYIYIESQPQVGNYPLSPLFCTG